MGRLIEKHSHGIAQACAAVTLVAGYLVGLGLYPCADDERVCAPLLWTLTYLLAQAPAIWVWFGRDD
jgi:hypothetical protein